MAIADINRLDVVEDTCQTLFSSFQWPAASGASLSATQTRPAALLMMKWSLSFFHAGSLGVLVLAAATGFPAMHETGSATASGFAQEQSVKASPTPGSKADTLPQKKKLIATKQVTAMKIFHVVNQTDAEIKVQALADGHELFVKRLEASVEKSPGIVHPYEAQYPSLELKIPLAVHARHLSIHESLFLKKRKRFEISVSPEKAGAGFQIIIGKDGIVVTQDYYPIR